MRIVFITNNYIPYSGGVVSSIVTARDILHAYGNDIGIITLDFLGKHRDPSYVFRIPCPIKFRYKTNYMAVPWRAAAYIQHIMHMYLPDIVHVHHPFLLGPIALHSARKLHIPVIFTYHTMYEHYTHYVPVPEIIIRPLVKKIVADFCTKVDGIIVPSVAVQTIVQSYTHVPIIIIPTSVHPLFIHQYMPQKKQHNVIQLLIVSRLAKEKNVQFLLDVFARLVSQVSCTLTIAGYGPDYVALQKYAYTTLLLTKKQIKFVHKPSKHVLVQLYKHADIFLFASQTDTQGVVLIESMACGTPVVALHGPGQHDIVRDGYNGFLVDSADAMIEKIVHIANDRALHTQLQHGAWRTAQNYGPEQMGQALIHFYQKIIQ